MHNRTRSPLSISVTALAALVGMLATASCGGDESFFDDAPPELESPTQSQTLAAEAEDLVGFESLIVTQTAVLDERFSFQRVLQHLVDQRPFGPQTAATLYAQWWDTQNDKAHGVSNGPHCGGFLNGFPIDCPRQEGLLAAESPFDGGADDYFPIALINRFDLAPADGANCGEYRMIFGKTSAFGPLLSAGDRNLIIFEPQMPNPHPELGLEGCRPIADFWADLSATPLLQRGAKLEQFYFEGIDGFPPALHIDHLGPNAGQIRSNQFMLLRNYFGEGAKLQLWQLREYEVVKPFLSFDIQIRQVTVKTNPFANLYDDSKFSFRGPGFRDHFLTQVATLASATDVNDLTFDVPEFYDAGQSTEQGNESNAVTRFSQGTGAFADAIQAELDAIGSPLTPTHIVRRAMTTSCAGCHQLSTTGPDSDLGGGLVFPASLVFTQVSERTVVFCDNPFQGLCFQISPALRDEFLPRRAEVLNTFLQGDVSTAQGALRVH